MYVQNYYKIYNSFVTTIKPEIRIRKEVTIMNTFIQRFDSQEKCDHYRKSLGSQEYDIYWKDAGGTIIRESETHDNIGNKQRYATIQLCDMIGSDGYADDTHIYQFAVFLYDNDEKLIDLFPTVQTAVNAYQNICKMIRLTQRLNEASDAYYGGYDEIMSNYEWDALFDDLSALEQAMGIFLPDSPITHISDSKAFQIGYGKQEPHEFPALSLAKSKRTKDLQHWAGDKPIWLSWKLDGSTLVVTYDNGKLSKIVTRGDGHVGINITYMAGYIDGIPLTIPYQEHLVIRGEAVISNKDFEALNMTLEEPYANPRNLAAGTLSLKPDDVAIVQERHVTFVPFTLVYIDNNNITFDANSWGQRMLFLETIGFKPVEHKASSAIMLPQDMAEFTEKLQSNQCPFPVDGLVICYDDVAYSQTGSVTGHHATRGGFAFKWPDTVAKTTLRDIEWSCATSVITPVAIFDPVELEGTTVARASLVNISEMKRLGIGQPNETTLDVIKANMIIPKVVAAHTYGTTVNIPDVCPVCHQPTRVNISTNGAETLICTNPDCAAKQLMRFVRFASKDGLDIDGLSIKTIELLINAGVLKQLDDIFHLEQFKQLISNLPGMGERSCSKLLTAIEQSRSITPVKFIKSLSIPMIGKDAAKRIFDTIGYQGFLDRLKKQEHFDDIEGIGPERDKSIQNWFHDLTNRNLFQRLCEQLRLEDHPPKVATTNGKCTGLTFVITGTVNHFANRNAFKTYVESQGGTVTGSVSKKTDYLINNDTQSTTSKNAKAKALGIPILSEDEFINRYGKE